MDVGTSVDDQKMNKLLACSALILPQLVGSQPCSGSGS